MKSKFTYVTLNFYIILISSLHILLTEISRGVNTVNQDFLSTENDIKELGYKFDNLSIGE